MAAALQAVQAALIGQGSAKLQLTPRSRSQISASRRTQSPLALLPSQRAASARSDPSAGSGAASPLLQKVETQEPLTADSLSTSAGPIIFSAAGLVAFLQCSPAWSAAEDSAQALADQEFFEFIIISLALVGAYLFVAPPLIYNYLRQRWYKRNMPETFFQYSLVFLFFPAMLLWAPFINFRALPRDSA